MKASLPKAPLSMIPDTEANRLQVEADKITVAAEDAAAAEQAIKDAADAEILAVKEAALAAKEAVKLARERAWDCKRLGLIGLDCPAPDLPLPDQLATN
jgi:hypothetical protein